MDKKTPISDSLVGVLSADVDDKAARRQHIEELFEELGISREELEVIDLLDEIGVPFAPDGSPLGIG